MLKAPKCCGKCMMIKGCKVIDNKRIALFKCKECNEIISVEDKKKVKR